MNTETKELWRCIPLGEYEAPAWPAGENVRRGVRSFLRSLKRRQPPSPTAVDAGRLSSLPNHLMEQVACEIELNGHLAALEKTFGPWAGSSPVRHPVRALVHAPHCATVKALSRWATDRGWAVVEPPTGPELLSGAKEWFANLGRYENVDCVLPELERCYRRHADGLDAMRRLIDWMLTRRGRTLIACNSWAWPFLSSAVGLEGVLPPAFTFAPLDAAALQRWFRRQQANTARPAPVFRSAATGDPVLTASTDDPDQPETPPHRILRDLAAGSRGIAGVGWAIWRRSLNVERDATVTDEARTEASEDRGATIWVRPWNELELPAAPPGLRQSQRFILHALLLHGGLEESEVAEVLPMADRWVQQGLRKLEADGLAANTAGRWQVPDLAYPTVRSLLASEEFLLDVL